MFSEQAEEELKRRQHERRVRAGKKCPNYFEKWKKSERQRLGWANRCLTAEAELDEYKKLVNDKHEKIIKLNDRLIKQEVAFSKRLTVILRASLVLLGLVIGLTILTALK